VRAGIEPVAQMRRRIFDCVGARDADPIEAFDARPRRERLLQRG
jgi:hypothetical protein